jgi:hypothetical protein
MRPRLWLLLGLCVAGISWLYVHHILGPWNSRRRLKNGFVIDQISDLYSPWVGTRELLLHRQNPYGPEVSHEIQRAFYGHIIDQRYDQPNTNIVDEQRFAYPVYEILLTAPLVYTDFDKVRRWAPFFLGALVALNVLVSLSILRWKLCWETVAALVLFIVSSPQISQALRLQQLAIVDAYLLMAAAWCVSKNRLVAGGALLAASTIKPQMALFPLCWFAIWSAGDWRRRWRVPACLLATLAALVAAGELLLPGWLGYFLAGLAAYRRYALPTSLLQMALGDAFGEFVGGIIILGMLAFAWRNRKAAGDSRQFISVLAAFLMGDLLAFPLFTAFNQLLLILPVLLLLRDWNTLRHFPKLVFVICISWPWVVSAVLLLLPRHVDSPSQLPLLPFFLVPFMPLILPLLLMTRRRQTTDLPDTDLSLA